MAIVILERPVKLNFGRFQPLDTGPLGGIWPPSIVSRLVNKIGAPTINTGGGSKKQKSSHLNSENKRNGGGNDVRGLDRCVSTRETRNVGRSNISSAFLATFQPISVGSIMSWPKGTHTIRRIGHEKSFKLTATLHFVGGCCWSPCDLTPPPRRHTGAKGQPAGAQFVSPEDD